MTVNIRGRDVTIRHIDASSKPAPSQIDPNRDHKSGHQLLIMRDNRQDGTLRLYEPELTDSGQHLEVLSDASLQRYFQDSPEYEIYRYIEIHSRLTPSTLLTDTLQ